MSGAKAHDELEYSAHRSVPEGNVASGSQRTYSVSSAGLKSTLRIENASILVVLEETSVWLLDNAGFQTESSLYTVFFSDPISFNLSSS